jgi:uncharacterized protein YozE (UPF0346 family)
VDTKDYDENGLLLIGEDDGSPLYESAQKAIASRREVDWPTFTTEGAREWFADQATKNTAMLKHADVTYRAAAAYADDQAKFVRDAATHDEIVRAFTESVEFLRNNYANQRTASVDHDDEADTFTAVYEDESEILW